MNRSQLTAFTTAYETKKLVKTAEKLYVSQSAVSQQLKKLEAELNTELFFHKKGQILPNEYGDLFYPYAKEALAALARGEDALRRRRQSDQKLVVYLYYNGSSAISRATQAFRESHPDLWMEMRRARPPAELQIAEKALYFVNETWVQGQNLHFVPLYRARYLCVMRKKDAPPGRRCLHLEDIQQMVHYLPPDGRMRRSPLLEEIQARLPRENLRRSPDFSTSLLNISISGGTCICPDYLFFSEELVGIPYCPEEGFLVGFAYAGAPTAPMEEFLACMKSMF